METERRRQILLAALAIMLAGVVYQAWPRTSAAPASASNERRPAAPPARGQTARGATSTTGTAEAPDVHLEALDAERPKPGDTERNLFRFKQKAPPPPPPGATKPVIGPPVTAPPVTAPPLPTGPPPPPPITLKVIGIVTQSTGNTKVAVFSDGVGPPVFGREGETVLGRYRILKIGVESVELAYLDGRGRQTIRLTGT
jgi:hypothetical protein